MSGLMLVPGYGVTGILSGDSLSSLKQITYINLPPYEVITEEKYKEMVKAFPKIDFSVLSKYEIEDQTTGAQELACASGVCSIDDITPPVVN